MLYEYQELWQDILSGTLGPIFIFYLILSLIIAGVLAVNDIGYDIRGDICLGNLGIVCFSWIAILILGIVISSFLNRKSKI